MDGLADVRAHRALLVPLVIPLVLGCKGGEPDGSEDGGTPAPDDAVVSVDIYGRGAVHFEPQPVKDCSNADPELPFICPVIVYRNGSATLTATPAPGWTFVGWTLPWAASTKGQDQVLMNATNPILTILPGVHAILIAHFAPTSGTGGPGGGGCAATTPPVVNGCSGGGLTVVQGLSVSRIVAVFDEAAKSTAYTVRIGNPDRHVLNERWSGPNCGAWDPQDEIRTSSAELGEEMTWSHPHPPCDATTDHHDVTVTFTVGDRTSDAAVECIYQGAASGVGPDCTVK